MVARRDLHVPPLKSIFESFHDVDAYTSRRYRYSRLSRRIKVMRFERPLTSRKAVIRLHPGIIRSVSPAILASHAHARRSSYPGRIQHSNSQARHRVKIVALLRDDLLL